MDAFESQFSGHPAESHPQPRGWSSGMRAEFATHRIEPGWHIKPLTPEAQALLFSLGNEIVDELERNIIQRGIKLGFSRADFQPLFEKIRPEAEKFLEETLYPEILPKVDAQGILVQDGSQEIFLEEWVRDEQEAREGKHPRPELAHGMKKDHILLLADGRVAEMKLDGVQSFEDYLFRIVTSGLSPKTKRQ